jgi:hypothetical protein
MELDAAAGGVYGVRASFFSPVDWPPGTLAPACHLYPFMRALTGTILHSLLFLKSHIESLAAIFQHSGVKKRVFTGLFGVTNTYQ